MIINPLSIINKSELSPTNLSLLETFLSQSSISDLFATFFQQSLFSGSTAILELCQSDDCWYCDSASVVTRIAKDSIVVPANSITHKILTHDRPIARLIFSPPSGQSFDRHHQSMIKENLSVFDAILRHVLMEEAYQEKCRELAKEKDYFSILVNITDSVILHQDIQALLAEIFDEVSDFFELGYIGVALITPQLHPGQYDLHSMWQNQEAPTSERGFIAENDPLIVQGDDRDRFDIRCLNSNDEQLQSSGLVNRLIQNQLLHICLLPLKFGHHLSQGQLILASKDSRHFDDRHLELLKKIASRISITVHNISADSLPETVVESHPRNKKNVLHEAIASDIHPGEIIYQSQAMQDVMFQVQMVAQSNCTVLIQGETGTGKELIARAIHRLSPRKNHEMVTINCAAIPATLIESDLFGHEKGVYTGAVTSRPGRFERANGSTLFLDEVGDMPLDLQPKLLRVLQEHQVERLGGQRSIPVDVRVIAATNKSLYQHVHENSFRSDLYYRLNVFPITVPPLRERPEDIPLLVRHFLQKISQKMNRTVEHITAEGLAYLSKQPWPGNVRELENFIERAMILTKGDVLQLPETLTIGAATVPVPEKTYKMPTIIAPPLPEHDDTERERIIQTLRQTNGIVAGPRGAAVRLGIKRSTLLSKMQRLGISAKEIL